MIIQTPETDIKMSGNMRTTSFGMKASAKGFKILSQNLYKDSILAIVRELSCNGWDAHQMNGNQDIPIDVHLPNQLEPWFSIRDYGIGMSDEDIFGVYTTVFDSTKDESNDVIGAMGLGSKTPFAYNGGQAFIVTSINNGMRAVYSAYLNDGIPDLTCLQEPKPTDEKDGVEVKVPVASGDSEKFIAAAKKCLFSFSKPYVKTNIDISEPKIKIDKDRYQVIDRPRAFDNSQSVYAKMGNILYPISSTIIGRSLYDKLRLMINTSRYGSGEILILKFDIGDIDIAASREELHYCDVTKAALHHRIKETIKEFTADAQKFLDDQKYGSIREAYNEMRKNYLDRVVQLLSYNGKSIEAWYNDLDKAEYLSGEAQIYYPEANYKNAKIRGNKCTKYEYRYSNRYIAATKRLDKTPLVIIHDDLKTNGVNITKEYIRQNGNLVFYYHDGKSTTHGYKKVTDRLEPSEYSILLTSDLKTQGYKPASRSTSSKPVQVFKFEDHKLVEANITVNDLENSDYYYVQYYQTYIEDGNGLPIFPSNWRTDPRMAKELIYYIMKSVDPKATVYAIRRPQLNRVKKNPNAKYVLSKDILAIASKKFDVDGTATKSLWGDRLRSRQLLCLGFPRLAKFIGVDPITDKFDTGMSDVIQEKFFSLCPGLKDSIQKRKKIVENQIKSVYNDYPVLNILREYDYTPVESVNQLVELIEGTKKCA